MATVREYITFRGDLTFAERPFGEVDYAVLCLMSYMNMQPIEPKPEQTFRSMVQQLVRSGTLGVQVLGDTDALQQTLQEIGQTTRFGDLVLLDHADILDERHGVQFSATTWQLHHNLQCVVFRGTDASVAGWKENFEASYTRSKAQQMAVEFTKKQLQRQCPTLLAGHSKGGNLAQYAAEMLNRNEAQYISHVYLMDSPGLCDDILEHTEGYLTMDRFTCFVPEQCVVGNIFPSPHIQRKIVKSTNSGLMQHDLASWCANGTSFLYAEKLDPSSARIQSLLEQILQGLPMQERQKFVDGLFRSIEQSGMTTLTQFSEAGASGFERVLLHWLEHEYTDSKRLLTRPIRKIRLVERLSRIWKKCRSIAQKKLPQNLAMILSGLAFCLIPQNIIKVVPAICLGGITLWFCLHTICCLVKSHFDLEKEHIRVSFSVFLLAITLIALLKNNTLFLIGSLVFGVIFLLMGVHSIRHIRSFPKKSKSFRIQIVKSCVYTLYGLFILVAPEESVQGYCFSVGIFLMLDGFSGLLY